MGDYEIMGVGNLHAGGGGGIRQIFKQFDQLKAELPAECLDTDLEEFEIFFYDERLFEGRNTDIYILKRWLRGNPKSGWMEVSARKIIQQEEKEKAYKKLFELNLIPPTGLSPTVRVAAPAPAATPAPATAPGQETPPPETLSSEAGAAYQRMNPWARGTPEGSKGGGKRKSKHKQSRKSKRKKSKKSRKRSKTRRRR